MQQPGEEDLRAHTSEARTQETGPKLTEKMMLVMNIIAIPALNGDKYLTERAQGKWIAYR